MWSKDVYQFLVQIGTDYNELVECNSRCGCGDSCINREMQRGLRTPIELYKTVYKGWAVRTLVSIPRWVSSTQGCPCVLSNIYGHTKVSWESRLTLMWSETGGDLLLNMLEKCWHRIKLMNLARYMMTLNGGSSAYFWVLMIVSNLLWEPLTDVSIVYS